MTRSRAAGIDRGESQWLERARQGEQAAFAELVEAYQRPVYNLCYRMLGDGYEAEDAAQETFLRAFKAIRRYDSSRPFATWLLSIASHYCIDLIRRRRMRLVPMDTLPGEAIPDPQLLPEALVRQGEATLALAGALGASGCGGTSPMAPSRPSGLKAGGVVSGRIDSVQIPGPETVTGPTKPRPCAGGGRDRRRGHLSSVVLLLAVTVLAACASPSVPSAAAPSTTPVCGNGAVESGEECDDGNAQNGDRCLTTCQAPANWIASDVHVHSTGCGRYASPGQLAVRLKAQGLQVGAALVWGEGSNSAECSIKRSSCITWMLATAAAREIG